jgi:hypothetical protein
MNNIINSYKVKYTKLNEQNKLNEDSHSWGYEKLDAKQLARYEQSVYWYSN